MSEGVISRPSGTLSDQAIELLSAGPVDSDLIARKILGIQRATEAIADRLAVALLGADPRVSRRHDGLWQLVTQAGVSTSLAECTFAVVDVETTGARHGGADRVVEIAVVLLHDGKCETILDTVVDPERPIPQRIHSLTKITPEEIRGKPVFDEIADDVIDALSGRVFVAHNVMFDWRFVSKEIERARGVVLDGPKLCTARLARKLVPGLKSRSLDSLAQLFGIEIPRRHRAGSDAWGTAELLRRLMERAEEQGVGTVRELLELGRMRKRRRKRSGRRRSALPHTAEEI